MPFLRPFSNKRAKLERALLSQMQPGEPSAAIRERVIKARTIQTERFSSLPTGEGGGRGRIHCNAMMTERIRDINNNIWGH